MTRIHTMTGADLPPLVYAHNSGHDSRLTCPSRFREVTADRCYLGKPWGCGLWTSPVTQTQPDGRPSASAWTEFAEEDLDDHETWNTLTVITPSRSALVALVDGRSDLVALAGAYPDGDYPAWWSIAVDFDAVYVTGRELGAMQGAGPAPRVGFLDCASVLWLRPAYTVGDTYPVRAGAAA